MSGKRSAARTHRGIVLSVVPWLACGIIAASCTAVLAKGSVLNSPHNLSASGTGAYHSLLEQRVCIFCHAPHSAQPGTALWNHDLPPDTGYVPYNVSSTLKASVSPVPTGASRLCLSCHDGTIALGSFRGSAATDLAALPAGSGSYLSKDLSADHPVSFVYDANLVTQKKNELASPQQLPAQIRLDAAGNLQCTACHDPHDNEFGKFLVMSNNGAGSPLCKACHTYTGWVQTNPHYDATRPRSDSDPTTVTGCSNCHVSHKAPKPVRLLDYVNEEDNCIKYCHNTAPKDVRGLFSAPYQHPVAATNSVHDEKEALPATTYHVECVDCHNPHQASAGGSPLSAPPAINGSLQGVRINSQDTIATTEYDICFKCHAGANAWRFTGFTNTKVRRQITEPDQTRRFDSGNPSIHPVTTVRSTPHGAASLNTGTNSLLSSLTRVYCSDCHGSDLSRKAGGSGPSGPHGSTYEHILNAQYFMPLSAQGYSDLMYDLCFRCHTREFVMGSGTGFAMATGDNEHLKHVQLRGIPCYVCHDPHGVPYNPLDPGAPKGTTTNNAHLINFALDFTGQNFSITATPVPVYQTTTPTLGGSGSCTISCHTANSCNKHSYPLEGTCP
jgi:predicted CXXCH cytochrome family protein